MFGIGMPELIVILVIALLVFGVKSLPEIGSGLGKAIRGFKEAADEGSGHPLPRLAWEPRPVQAAAPVARATPPSAPTAA
jgi:sec-independent protein translocase protein TatA